MSIRNDTYIGGEHYWIRFHMGTHEVRRETYSSEPDNETVYSGSFEACLAWLRRAEAEYESEKF